MNAPYPPPQGQLNPMPAQGLGQNAPNPMQAQMAQALQAQPKPVTHDITIVTTKKLAQAKVMGVPPEEFGIERGARDIPTCNYCFHEVVTKSVAQLINEGFDKEQVNSLTEYTGLTDIETLTRDTEQEHYSVQGSSTNDAARLVKVTEHYIRMDYEGNGKPCLYQVVTGGDQGQVLKKDGKPSITPFDAIPFAATTPVPITHRFFGRSMADLVMDIQRIKTALLRNALDSQYLAAGADVELPEAANGPSTIDDLLGPKRPGRVIRTKLGGMLKYQEVPDTSPAAFAAMQYMDGLMETRTGVTKQGQGIDANALQNQSATAVAQMFSMSQMRMKLVARIMAEGVKDMFSLLHATIRKHGQEAQTVRLRNAWVSVDPRQWKSRDDMTINVGLGNGSKAQQFAQLMALGNIQEKILGGGKANLVGDQEIFNLASAIAKVMGHKNADKFFNDPSAKDPQTGQLLHPPIPPQPSEKVQAAQVKGQVDQQANAQKAQIEQLKAADKAQADQAKAQLDAVHQQVKMQAELELAKIKADLDAKLKIIDAHVKMTVEAQKMHHAGQQHQLNTAETVMGMAATAHAHDASMEQGAQSHEARLEQMAQKPTPKKD